MKKEIFKKVMVDFYSEILKDEHASSFISSLSMLEELIERQYVLITKLFKKECDKNLLTQIAKRHKEIGIHYKVMFDSISIFVKLSKEYGMLDNDTIDKFKKDFEKITAREYIHSIVYELERFLKTEGEFRELSKYDKFVYEEVVKYLEFILNIVDEKDVDAKLLSHTNCNIGKFLNGLPFKIISFENEIIGLKVKTIHKTLHTLLKDLVAYNHSRNFHKAVATVVEISENIYRFLNEYRQLSINWGNRSHEIIASFASSIKSKDGIYSLIINIQANEKILEFLNGEICKILNEFFYDFDFLFFNKYTHQIKIFLNKKAQDFENKYKALYKKIETLSKNIEENYTLLVSTPILYVATLDMDKLNYLSKEEIKEVFNLIKKDLIATKSNTFILVKNYDDEFITLLERAREAYLIRKCSIEAVIERKIELFGHFMYNLRGEKVGMEILSRIKKDEEYIPAYKFIEILQEEKLMEKLDYAVLRKLAENIEILKNSGVKRIFVNVYPPSLMDSEVIGVLKSLIDIFTKNNLILYLELTEYAILPSSDILDLLNEKKFKIAFDDFGSGSTNYELIGEMAHRENAEVIKIDGVIVKNILSSEVYKSIFRSISMFAKSINMLIVCEFVENKELVEQIEKVAKEFKLDKNDVYIQGFYYHIPESISKLTP